MTGDPISKALAPAPLKLDVRSVQFICVFELVLRSFPPFPNKNSDGVVPNTMPSPLFLTTDNFPQAAIFILLTPCGRTPPAGRLTITGVEAGELWSLAFRQKTVIQAV